MDVRAEMNKELRRARGWLLGVGILMFLYDMVMVHLGHGAAFTSTRKAVVTAVDAVILAIFVGLWWFAKRKPRLCLTLGLVLFWALQLVNAWGDPKTLFGGFILKIVFTVALVKGIRTAGRVELLRDQLVNVFE
jgi:peptidoglycan/LPS O-acetylase OafA/YrhL